MDDDKVRRIREAEDGPGVGTDGSLHSAHDEVRDEADDELAPGVGTDGSLHSTDKDRDRRR